MLANILFNLEKVNNYYFGKKMIKIIQICHIVCDFVCDRFININ